MQVEPRPGTTKPYERGAGVEAGRGAEPPRPARFTLDRVIRLALGAGAVLLVVWLLWYFAALVLYLLIGVVLAYLMKPLVDRMQGLGLGRILSILITFVVVFGTFSLLLTYLVPFLTRQLTDLSQQLSPQAAARVTAVEPGSFAERAGLRPGDLIVSVDGEPWQGYSQLQMILRSKAPGERLGLVVEDAERGRRFASAVFTQEDVTREEAGLQPSDEARERSVGPLGVTVREVTVFEMAASVEGWLRRILPLEPGVIIGGVSDAFETLFHEGRITQAVGSALGIFTDIFYAVVVIPFVAFFFLKDGTRIRLSLLRLVPNRYFEVTLAVIEKIQTNIGRYFRALLLQCLSVAAVASVLLYFVGLKYALAIGIFTGLANTIPYFGPLMGFLAGTLVGIAQTGDFSLVPGVLIAMGLTQLVDNVLLQPFFFSRAARAHPLIILFVVLIGAQLAGIVGMLVAIPLTTTLRVAVEQVLWSLRNYRILRTAR